MSISEQLFIDLAHPIIQGLPEPEIQKAALIMLAARTLAAEQVFNETRSLPDEERKNATAKAHKKLTAAVRASSENSEFSFEHGARPNHF